MGRDEGPTSADPAVERGDEEVGDLVGSQHGERIAAREIGGKRGGRGICVHGAARI